MMKNFTLTFFVKNYRSSALEFENYTLLKSSIDGDYSISNDEKFSPTASSVNTILNFAKSYDVLHSSAAGCIELNRN